MNDQSSMFDPKTSEASPSATSSQGSEAGPTRSDSPDGPTTDQSGLDHAPVSRFRARASKEAMTTNDTSGPLFSNSSISADLQRSLENRLRANLEGNGSPEYALTWKHWDMPLGPPICALRASGHRTSGNGCSGWATPTARDGAGRTYYGGGDLALGGQAALTGWATPRARDWKDTGDPKKLRALVSKGSEDTLGRQVHTSPAPTASKGASLNPAFSLWLMGYPIEWAHCAERVTQSSRKSRRSS